MAEKEEKKEEEKNSTIKFNGEDREYVLVEADHYEKLKEDAPKYFVKYGKTKEGVGKVWISKRVPPEYRPYMVFHEFEEAEGADKKKCPEVLKAELEIVPKKELDDYIKFRADVYEDLLAYIPRRISKLKLDLESETDQKKVASYKGEIEYWKGFAPEVDRGLKYLKGRMLIDRLHNYVEKREKDSGLEKKTSGTLAILGTLGGLFFLSSNLTGNIVGNMTNSTSNWIGGVLFIVGLVGALIYFRKK